MRGLSLGLLLTALAGAGAPAFGATDSCSDLLFTDGFEGVRLLPELAAVADQPLLPGDSLELNIDTLVPADQADLRFRFRQAPEGMSLDPQRGLVTWTPTPAQVGDFPVVVQVVDPAGLTASVCFSVNVPGENATPVLAAVPDRTLAVGEGYAYTAVAQDPDPGDTLRFSLDAAPRGMSVDPVSGLLEWVPGGGDLGISEIVLRVTDGDGRSDSTPFRITVVAPNQAPVLGPVRDRVTPPEILLEVPVTATDPDDTALRYALAERPPGMAIDPSTGLIRWTPGLQQLGPHPVTVSVTDPAANRDETHFTVTVTEAPNQEPVAVDDAFVVTRGQTLTVAAPGVLDNDSDPEGDPLAAVLETGPGRGAVSLNGAGSFDYTPDSPVGSLGFVEKYGVVTPLGSQAVMDQPYVADLDGDGIPEIVHSNTYDGASTRLYAVRGSDGSLVWERFLPGRIIVRSTMPAIGDIDLDGRPEIVLIGGDNDTLPTLALRLYAFEHDGSFKWVSDPLPQRYAAAPVGLTDGEMRESAITLADLDQDGTPEILAAGDGALGYHVWNNEGRKLDYVFTTQQRGGIEARAEVVDLDLDGAPDVVVGNAAWTGRGELRWIFDDLPMSNLQYRNYPIAANLDDDPYPELVLTRALGDDVLALNHDGSLLWSADGSRGLSMSPLSVADVDGDGRAELLFPGVLSDNFFRVLHGADGTVKWEKELVETGYVGATAFDLDRDGIPEVLFMDEFGLLYVWDGRDGTEKLVFDTLPDTSNSVLDGGSHGMPIFADVDADGASELLLMGGGAFSPRPAFVVWESPGDDWGPTRPIWNQFNYHATNVNLDGTIPASEEPHWLLPGLNRNRVNAPLPQERIGAKDQFTYRADDGERQSGPATVRLTILPPNAPPQILSTPVELASPGFEYRYPMLAVDGDAGEALSFALAQAPAGMTISPVGIITWTPGTGDLGVHPVAVEVQDGVGAVAWQNFMVDVRPPVTVPDLAGLSESAAVDALAAVSLVAEPVAQTFSDAVPAGHIAGQDPAAGSAAAAGAAVRIEVSRGPVPVEVPDVLGLDAEAAAAAITAAGLVAGAPAFANDPLLPIGRVRRQDPPPRALAQPGTTVAVEVSGGPRAEITVTPTIINAGESAEVSVSVRNPDGTLLAPEPVVSLALAGTDEVAGTAPTLSGATIQTGSDSWGVFRVTASFAAPDPESIETEIAVMQPIGDGRNVFSEFFEQIKTFGSLIAALDQAVTAGDTAQVEALDTALGELEDALDLTLLASVTPFAVAGGVLPDPATAAGLGFPEGPADAPFRDLTMDLLVLLEEIRATVATGTAPDAVNDLLNQDLAEAAAALGQLDPGVFGVLDAQEAIVALLGTRLPELLATDIAALRGELRDAGLVGSKAPVSAAAKFSLPGVLLAGDMRWRLTRRIYGPYLYQVVRSAATIAIADALQPYVNGGAIVGIVTGASLTLNIFERPNSVIEGFGFDTLLAEGNSVRFIGPDLIDTVVGYVNRKLPEAKDFKDLNDIKKFVDGEIKRAQGLEAQIDNARSTPSAVLRGCILDNLPTCRQLVYPGGFKSVYTASGDAVSFPAPVAILVHNLAGGGMALFVANFYPTFEEQ